MSVVTLWERGPHIGHKFRCGVIVLKDVECLIGFRHKKLGFIKQVAAIDSSRGVSVDQFRDDML